MLLPPPPTHINLLIKKLIHVKTAITRHNIKFTATG
jgi:hypothetical protein